MVVREPDVLAVPHDVRIEEAPGFEDEATAPRPVSARAVLKVLQARARLGREDDDIVTDPRPRDLSVANDRPVLELALATPLFRDDVPGPPARVANAARVSRVVRGRASTGSRAWLVVVLLFVVAVLGWIALAPSSSTASRRELRPPAERDATGETTRP